MINKADYETIPDVESGTSPAIPLDPKSRYPEANDLEADLLCLLDSCISSPLITVEVPKLTIQKLATTNGSSFVKSLYYPTLVTTLMLAAFFFTTNSTTTLVIISFLLVFMSTIPAIQKRLGSTAEGALHAVQETGALIESGVDDARNRFDEIVDKVQTKLVHVMEPMLPTLDKVSRLEKQLQAVDPDIDLPTSDDMLVELVEAKDTAGAALQKALNSMNLDGLIPQCLTSPDAFQNRVTIPMLVACFVTQAFGTYAVWLLSSAGSLAPVLAPFVFESLVLFSLFTVTAPAAVATFLSPVRDTANMNLQAALRENGADETFKEVLGDRMSKIREKLLKLIKKLSKIEPILKTVSLSMDIPIVDQLIETTEGTAAVVVEATTESATKAASTLTRMGSWGVGNIFGSKKK